MMSSTPDATVEVLLQFEHATLNEIKLGKPQPLLQDAEVILVSLVPTEEQVQGAAHALGLPDGAITVGDGTPLVFLLVGEYKIPVAKNIIAIQAGPLDYTFVIPNQLFLQIILPPQGILIDELDALEHVIFSYANLKKRPTPTTTPIATTGAVVAPQAPSRVSTRIAIGLGKVTKVACVGLAKGAELVSHGVNKGTDKIVEVTDACKEPMKVSDSTKGHIQRARVASKGVAVLSGSVATAMVGITTVVGGFIGSRVANRLAASDNNGSTVDRFAAVKEVGGAAIGCVAMVFDAAADAGKVILSSSCDGISKVVTHKLGAEAGETTANGLGVVEDVVNIQSNVRQAGLKGIARATAKSSAASLFETLEKKEGDK